MNRGALFLDRLREPLQSKDTLLRLRTQWLEELQPSEIIELLEGLTQLATDARHDATSEGESGEEAQAQVWEGLLPVLLEGLLRAAQRQRAKLTKSPDSEAFVNAVAKCYSAVPTDRPERSTLLELLTLLASQDSLRQFAELVVTQPPVDGMRLDRSFARVFQNQVRDPRTLFPRLLDGLSQPGVATAVLDLANYFTREQRCDVHPAAERVDDLMELLAGLVARLGSLERAAADPTLEPEQTREQVADGVALGVALCDALGWIGDPRAIPKLNQASELAHRRLRVEAFAALARLDDARGKAELVAMAQEPAMRLRAVHYAEELGLESQIDEALLTPVSLAEAELVAWLSEPRQFGIPPQQIELFEQRTLFWPGFNEPVGCFLFRFEYQSGDARYANMGLAGPLAHAFLPDLSDLPPLDIYAAFAGWHSTHHDIFELPVESIEPSRRADYDNLEKQLASLGFETPTWHALGVFFGEHVFVGEATKAGTRGALALSMLDYAWFPIRPHERSIDAELAFSIWKGRRFLKQFNPTEDFSVSSADLPD